MTRTKLTLNMSERVGLSAFPCGSARLRYFERILDFLLRVYCTRRPITLRAGKCRARLRAVAHTSFVCGRCMQGMRAALARTRHCTACARRSRAHCIRCAHGALARAGCCELMQRWHEAAIGIEVHLLDRTVTCTVKPGNSPKRQPWFRLPTGTARFGLRHH